MTVEVKLAWVEERAVHVQARLTPQKDLSWRRFGLFALARSNPLFAPS